MKPVTSHIALTRTNGAPLSVNATVAAGEPVLVAGLSPSATPWDALAVFEWDKGGGTTEAQTNAFTVMGAHLIGDFDNDWAITAPDVTASLPPPPDGLVVFSATGGSRLISLDDHIDLPGEKVLSFESDIGGIFAWDMGGPSSGEPRIFPGEAFSNNLPSRICVEAYGHGGGTATLSYTYTGAGAASNLTYSTSMRFTLCRPQADIDNKNHWSGEYFTDDYKTPSQRALRDQTGPYIGKVLFVNDIDKDGSGTPDYMDGWGCTTTQIPLLEREKTIGSNHRYHNPENKFVPMGVSVEGLPTSIDTANVRIKFDYPESPPETMQLVTDNWDVEQFERSKSGNTIHLTRTVPRVRVVSNTGKIRIWKTDGNAQRNVATDYVRSSQTLMTYNDLQGINGKLFLEAINACTNWSGMRIVVSLSLDGGSTWAMSNAVRVTSMRCNFTAGVVRPFTFNGNDRVPFEPDYSTPLAAFTKAVSAFQGVQKHNDANGGGDRWWHDEDGSLGHGFAYFQYEGPDLGDTLTVRCSSLLGRRHDRRWYFGKTGDAGLTHWDYGAGNVNTQEQLAWWDICEHEIGEGGDLKKLVVKQTYTLKPERASALFDIFNDIGPAGRYANFGLHINTDPDVKGWGCLSNVGLAMATNKLDVANITRCAVSVNMPTTVNKSVWEVIEGARLTSYSQGGVPGSLTRAVWLETFGVAWDGDKETLGANALQGNLFNVLNGQPLAKRHPTSLSGFPTSEVTITNIGDITLDNARDNLRFYDPGLFPGVFGEQPKNVFNMEVGQ